MQTKKIRHFPNIEMVVSKNYWGMNALGFLINDAYELFFRFQRLEVVKIKERQEIAP